MQLNISGHHMNNGNSLEEYAREKLDSNVNKFFADAISADVTFSKVEHNFIKTIIIINEGKGKHHDVVSEASSEDAYKSFDEALHKVIVQLKKDKEKLKAHHQKEGLKAKEQAIA